MENTTNLQATAESESLSPNFEVVFFAKMHTTEELFVALRFKVAVTNQVKEVVLPLSVVNSPRFLESIPVGFVLDEEVPFKKYAEFLREKINEKVKTTTCTTTLLTQGFHCVDGRNMFVSKDCIINKGDADVLPYVPNGSISSNGTPINKKEAIQWVKLFLAQGEDKAVLLVAALVPYLKTISDRFSLPSKTVNAYVVGKSGSGKTSFSSLLAEGNSINLGTDTSALYAKLEGATDVPVLVDDLNLSSSQREMEKKLQRLSELIQLSSGGGVTVVKGKEIKAGRLGLLITAEYVPKSPSTINRTVVINCSETFSSKALTELQSKPNMFRDFVILFLTWLLANEARIRILIGNKLAKGTFEYVGKHDRQSEYTGWARIMASHKLLQISSYLLMRFLMDNKSFRDEDEKGRYAGLMEKGITQSIEDTLELVHTKTEMSKILSVILEVFYRDPDDIIAKSYKKFKESDKKLLFRYKNDYYYFRGESLSQYVEAKCGEPVAPKTLSGELFKANLLVPCGGELSAPLPLSVHGEKKSKHKKRYYRLSIPALEDFLYKNYSGRYFDAYLSPLIQQRN